MKRTLLATASAILLTSFAHANIPENAYLWIHPKLGAIWVDKTTNAPITSASATNTESAQKVSSRSEQKYQLRERQTRSPQGAAPRPRKKPQDADFYTSIVGLSVAHAARGTTAAITATPKRNIY